MSVALENGSRVGVVGGGPPGSPFAHLLLALPPPPELGAPGVNSPGGQMLDPRGFRSRRPATTKAYITELALGQAAISRHFGSSMHLFLLDMPRLDCAAIIPKGDFLTVCLLGKDIDRELINAFFAAPSVARCFPPGQTPAPGA